ITATNKVPLRELIPLEVVAQESIVTKVYTRRPNIPKTNGFNSKPKIPKSMISNKTKPDFGCSKHMTKDRSQLTNFVYKFLDNVKFGNDQIAKIMSEPKIAKSIISNKTEPGKSWGYNTSVAPSSSFVDLRFQIVLWYLDSGCSKLMTGDRSQLTNFVHKFLDTVKFGNDQIEKIMGYGDYHIENITISRVYYVEGSGHNLFFVVQFCDSDLKVAFRKHTCFVRNLEGDDLLSGSQETNLYTLSIVDMMASSPIFLLSKASKIKSWLWHRRLSH
nr:integrase, catalytic region, zinc finger, CCHC-type, peptidase aspartic, catalytic [Tanacetum cinerariifolium]